MPNQSGKIALLALLILFSLGVLIYFVSRQDDVKQSGDFNVSEVSKKNSFNLYSSESLNLSFRFPIEGKIEEKATILYINFPNGVISITENGTNFRNAEDYFSDLKEKNRFVPLESEGGQVNGYDYLLARYKTQSEKSGVQRTYFVYFDNNIVAASADKEELYPVLDQIVQTFEYIP